MAGSAVAYFVGDFVATEVAAAAVSMAGFTLSSAPLVGGTAALRPSYPLPASSKSAAHSSGNAARK